MQVLSREPLGSFMVRESESVAGSLALSLRQMASYLAFDPLTRTKGANAVNQYL